MDTVTDDMLVDQTFTARPSAEGEGGNYVVEGSACGIVTRFATEDIGLAERSAEAVASIWAAIGADERHRFLHNAFDCERCEAPEREDEA